MYSRFDLPNSPDPFDSNTWGPTPELPFKITKEYLFYMFYLFFMFAVLLNANYFFGKYDFVDIGGYRYNLQDITIILIVGFISLFLISNISKYFIIKFELNSGTRYGNIISKKPLKLFNLPLVYVEYRLAYKDSFILSGGDYIDIKKRELYGDEIYFVEGDKESKFTERFKLMDDFKCENKVFKFTYEELMDKFEIYSLDKIFTKDEIERFATDRDGKLHKDKEFLIEIDYIINDKTRKDAFISEEKSLIDYGFDIGNFWAILGLMIFVSYSLYDEFLMDTEQEYLTLLFKSFQYNLFFYFLLFLTLKKNLDK